MRQCSKCNLMFEKLASRSSMCKSCHNEYTRQHYKDNKQYYVDKARRNNNKLRDKIRELKSNKRCIDCKIIYPHYVMDFDHIGEQKNFNVSNFHKYGLETILKEIDKCELVCSNCHRIRTWSRLHHENAK